MIALGIGWRNVFCAVLLMYLAIRIRMRCILFIFLEFLFRKNPHIYKLHRTSPAARNILLASDEGVGLNQKYD